MVEMDSAEQCRECGTAIPAESPGGFCARCLLKLGLEEVQNAERAAQNQDDDSEGCDKPDVP